jgi:predicted Fe-Mo cluster-binding NifX family protein
MRGAISAGGSTPDAEVDPRFGRCSSFVLVETGDMTFEAVEKESRSLGGGAGIQAAQLMARRGVKAVLTGSCGPNACQALSAAGIEVFEGCSGTVSSVVERFRSGQPRPATAPNSASHSGLGSGGR